MAIKEAKRVTTVVSVSEVPLGLLSLTPIEEGLSRMFELKPDGLLLYMKPFKIGVGYSLMDGTDKGQAEVLEYLSQLGHVNHDQVCDFHQVSHLVLKDEAGVPTLHALPRSDQWHFGGDGKPVNVSIDRFQMGVEVDEWTGKLSSFTHDPNVIGFFITAFRNHSR